MPLCPHQNSSPNIEKTAPMPSEVSSCPPWTQQCVSNCLNLKAFYLRAVMCVPLTGCHAFERDPGLCSRQLLSVRISESHPYVTKVSMSALLIGVNNRGRKLHERKKKRVNFYTFILLISDCRCTFKNPLSETQWRLKVY